MSYLWKAFLDHPILGKVPVLGNPVASCMTRVIVTIRVIIAVYYFIFPTRLYIWWRQYLFYTLLICQSLIQYLECNNLSVSVHWMCKVLYLGSLYGYLFIVETLVPLTFSAALGYRYDVISLGCFLCLPDLLVGNCPLSDIFQALML